MGFFDGSLARQGGAFYDDSLVPDGNQGGNGGQPPLEGQVFYADSILRGSNNIAYIGTLLAQQSPPVNPPTPPQSLQPTLPYYEHVISKNIFTHILGC